MIRPIFRDEALLSRPSLPAGADDLATAQDLLDTLRAHQQECVGMAANMIGVSRRIIAFNDEGRLRVMLNPKIIRRSRPYETEEACRWRACAPRRAISPYACAMRICFSASIPKRSPA